MVAWAARAVIAAGLWKSAAVVGPGSRVAEVLPDQLQVLINPDPSRGLGSSLAVGARWALEVGAGVMVVVLGDMPLVRPEVIAAVAREAWRVPAGAASGIVGQRRVHPVGFARAHLKELAELEGDVGGGWCWSGWGRVWGG